MKIEVFQTMSQMPLSTGTLSPAFLKPTFHLQMPQELLKFFFCHNKFWGSNGEQRNDIQTQKPQIWGQPHTGYVMDSLYLSTLLIFKMKELGKRNEAMPVKTL